MAPSNKTPPAPAFAWVDKTPTWSTLDLEVIVMQVIGRKPDEWIVTTSHGEPKGEYADKISAQRYAVKFAATMIEKTLAGLAEIESMQEVPTIGWKGRSCVLLHLRLDPHKDFEADDGTARADVFEQRRQAHIDDNRAKLRGILVALDR